MLAEYLRGLPAALGGEVAGLFLALETDLYLNGRYLRDLRTPSTAPDNVIVFLLDDLHVLALIFAIGMSGATTGGNYVFSESHDYLRTPRT